MSGLAIDRLGLRDSIVHLSGAVSLISHGVNTVHFCHTAFLRAAREFRMDLSPYHTAYERLHARLERRVFRRCTGPLVAVSRKVRAELGEVTLPNQRIRVIHNGAGGQSPVPRSLARQKIEREFGFEHETTVLLFAGELKRGRKGFGTALRAMELLRDEPGLRLLVAGREQGSPYRAEVARRDLGHRVVFCGFRRDLPLLLAGADVLIFPTYYDTFGMVVLEAMAAGTPVVVSAPAYCGAAELISDGKSGIVLQDPSNAEELRSRLLSLLRDREIRRSIGEAGRVAAAPVTWERMCQEYDEVYRDVQEARQATTTLERTA
jgi:UDP-glucose:(heptosyl)LPS alpha-1,3-glucosyltransferase